MRAEGTIRLLCVAKMPRGNTSGPSRFAAVIHIKGDMMMLRHVIDAYRGGWHGSC